MSEEETDAAADNTSCESCACCGIAEIDDIKLVPCDDCDLVKYCSDECQENHRSEHEEECKKRAAELRDELLFKQPEGTHWGDCPICSLPLPFDKSKITSMSCCFKFVCDGCVYANRKREREMRLQHTCPFCREPAFITKEEADKLRIKRVEANDPNAMRYEGGLQYNKGEYSSAFEYYTKTAELGDAGAHNYLACMYHEGKGVEKDVGKYIHHLEEAAIGGHPIARYFLGMHEWEIGNVERAVTHFMIAATLGDDDSLEALMDMFKEGSVEKEDLAAALRAHKAAVDATKSPQRKTAEEYKKGIRGS